MKIQLSAENPMMAVSIPVSYNQLLVHDLQVPGLFHEWTAGDFEIGAVAACNTCAIALRIDSGTLRLTLHYGLDSGISRSELTNGVLIPFKLSGDTLSIHGIEEDQSGDHVAVVKLRASSGLSYLLCIASLDTEESDLRICFLSEEEYKEAKSILPHAITLMTSPRTTGKKGHHIKKNLLSVLLFKVWKIFR